MAEPDKNTRTPASTEASKDAVLARRMPLDSPQVLQRRTGPNGVAYCACCDTPLVVTTGRGRPPTACTPCRLERRHILRLRYEAERTAKRRQASASPATRTDAVSPIAPSPGLVLPAPLLPGQVIVDETRWAGMTTRIAQLRQALDRAPRPIERALQTTWVAEVHRSATELVAWHGRSSKGT